MNPPDWVKIGSSIVNSSHIAVVDWDEQSTTLFVFIAGNNPEALRLYGDDAKRLYEFFQRKAFDLRIAESSVVVR